MPELRRDPIVGRWVIVATERAQRPSDFHIEREPPRAGPCPFCPGREGHTPSEVLAYRPSTGEGARHNGPGWSVRVFPNKYPALKIEGDLERAGEGIYDWMQGIGAHEVIVETADHARQLHSLDAAEIARVLEAWRDRMVDLANDRRFRYVQVFKNHGAIAGATIDHSHSQLIALPTVPKHVADEIKGARDYFDLKERCIFCDIVRQELQQRTRVICDNPDFVVIAPYASRSPFETWIVPRRHRVNYQDCSVEELASLAGVLRTTLRKLNRALDDPPYNLYLHTVPLHERETPYYHWHIEIVPTLTRPAGFELGSGFYINPTPPEDAARFLADLGEV